MVGRDGAGPPDRTDKSQARHPEGVRRFTSHVRPEEPAPPCQLAPGQPPQTLTGGSVQIIDFRDDENDTKQKKEQRRL